MGFLDQAGASPPEVKLITCTHLTLCHDKNAVDAVDEGVNLRAMMINSPSLVGWVRARQPLLIKPETKNLLVFTKYRCS